MPVKMPEKKNPYEEHLAPPNLNAKSGTANVTIEKKGQHIGASSETVTPPLIHEEKALFEIEVQGGRTINLGNYESAKINVSLRMPCSAATLDDTYEFASNWVSARVEEATEGAK